jgi:IS4 transposase
MSAGWKYFLTAVACVILALWFLIWSGLNLNVGQVLLFWSVVFTAQWLVILARDC